MASERKPLSAETRAMMNTFQHNIATPLKLPAFPKRSIGRRQRLNGLQTKGHAKVANIPGLDDSLFKNPTRKTAFKLERNSRDLIDGELKDNSSSDFHQAVTRDVLSRAKHIPGSLSAVGRSEEVASVTYSKPPFFRVDIFDGDINPRQEKSKGDVIQMYSRDRERLQKPSSQVLVPWHNANRNMSVITQQEHTDDTDRLTIHITDSLTFKQHLQKARSIRTPLKTYSQNRTIAASQDGRVVVGERSIGDDDDLMNNSPNRLGQDALDETDREISQLGEVALDLDPAHTRNTSPIVPQRAPKHPRATKNSASIDGMDEEMLNVGDWAEEDFGEPIPKKQRRSKLQVPDVVARAATLPDLKGNRESKAPRRVSPSRTSGVEKLKLKASTSSKKKASRRLPVHELFTAWERLDDQDEEECNTVPAEVPDDPILVAQDELNDKLELPTLRGRKTATKICIKWSPGFGPINIGEFRIPQTQTGPSGIHQSICSDGFVGKEAEPIGRFMPRRQTSRCQTHGHKVTLKMGELTLVAELQSQSNSLEEQEYSKPRRNPKKSTTATKSSAKQKEPMLIDKIEVQFDHEVEALEHHGYILGHRNSSDRKNEETLLQQVDGHQAELENLGNHELDEGAWGETVAIGKIESEPVQSETGDSGPRDKIEKTGQRDPNAEYQRLSFRQDYHKTQSAIRDQRKANTPGKPPLTAFITAVNLKSCLKRQHSTGRRVSFAERSLNQQKVSQRSPRSQSLEILQPLNSVRELQKYSKGPSRSEIEIARQMNMVTGLRPRTSESGSEDEYEKSSSEEQSDLEEYSEDGDDLLRPSSTQHDGIDRPHNVAQTTQAAKQREGRDHDESRQDLPRSVRVDDDLQNDELLATAQPCSIEHAINHDSHCTANDIKPGYPQAVTSPPTNDLRRLSLVIDPQPYQERREDLQEIARQAVNTLQVQSQTAQQITNANPSLDSHASWRPSQSVLSADLSVQDPQTSAMDTAQMSDKSRDTIHESQLVSPANVALEESDSSWQPTQLSLMAKEMLEDIETSPTPILARQRASSHLRSQSQRQSRERRQRQPLALISDRQSPEAAENTSTQNKQDQLYARPTQESNSQEYIKRKCSHRCSHSQRTEADQDSQGSLILGGSQSLPLLRHLLNDEASQASTVLGASQPLIHRQNDIGTQDSQSQQSAILGGSQPRGLRLKPLDFPFAEKDESKIAGQDFRSDARHSSPAEIHPEIPSSQLTYVPESQGYFMRASREFQHLERASRLFRTRSTPDRLAPLGPGSEISEVPEMMAGGITMREAFLHTARNSPAENTYRTHTRLPTLSKEDSSHRKALMRNLTRNASISLGTMPGSARKRAKSLPFVPPFKKAQSLNKASTV